MLKEIKCDKFRVGSVVFGPGLNVVMGDDVATNSIGKSTFLMVLDFVLGGDTFLDHNSDVVSELGHHVYLFRFEFDGKNHSFSRRTDDPQSVFRLSDTYEIEHVLDIREYREFLGEAYGVGRLGLSFRAVMSPFARIWGKENLDPKRPLDDHKKRKAVESLQFLLKLYEFYEAIAELADNLEKAKSKKKALNTAMTKEIVPGISAKKYRENEELVERVSSELEDIQENLARYAVSIREISNREVSEIKEEKDLLLQTKVIVDSRARRIRSFLKKGTRRIKSRQFEGLKEFFPDVDEERLAEVDGFHSKISEILRAELRSADSELQDEQSRIESELGNLDARLSALLKNVENPGVIVDRIYELASTKREALEENRYHRHKKDLLVTIKDVEVDLKEDRDKLLSRIAAKINDTMRLMTTRVFGSDRKSPSLTFSATNYEFEIHEDTGTGKAYSNLVLFDWALFETSDVPVLIHDSLLFKNVENDAVSKMFETYSGFEKQIFAAIDEVPKYGDRARNIIEKHTVLRLANDSVLYTKDWRTKRSS